MPVVAVTGSFCSGKTTVLGILKDKGADVFNADRRIRQYYKNNRSIVCKKVKVAFPGSLTVRGNISPRRLGEIVFSGHRNLVRLERIVHPFIIKELEKWVKQARKRKGVFVAEVPLLFEKKLDIIFDRVILVYASKPILFHRIKSKFGMSKKEALSRLELFSPWQEKKKGADFLINNVSGVIELKRKVGLIWQDLKRG